MQKKSIKKRSEVQVSVLNELKVAPLSDTQVHMLQDTEKKLNQAGVAMTDDHEIYLLALERKKEK